MSSLGFLLFLLGVLAFLRVLPETLLDQFDKLSSVGNLFVSVVSLAVGVVALRQVKAQSLVPQTQGQVADQLASAVRRQWEGEAEVRRLNDPYPLPVSWGPAPDCLFVSWESIEFAARTGAGSRRDPTGWASSPSELCGTNNELADVVSRRVPSSRLVVLGEPGAGKTMLLVRLVLDLLGNRESIDGRVPVLVSLASWNPAEQDLRPWLRQTMITDNPWLRQSAPGEASGVTCMDMLLDGHKILPILDGLDEIPDAGRASAIEKINDWLASSMENLLVLSSRLGEYKTMVQTSQVAGAKLSASAGVILNDLAAADIKDYLERDAGDAAAVDRWSPVMALLGKGGPVGLALHTPLMVGLARTIYNPRGGEPIRNVKNPDELCRTDKFPDRHAVEQHLFDGFIPAAYRKHPDKAKRCPWKAAKAERWLRNLARHLGNPDDGPPAKRAALGKTAWLRNLARHLGDSSARRAPLGQIDLAWWELHASVSPWLIGAAATVVPGLAVGLAAGYGAAENGKSLGIGLGVGLLLGVAVAAVLSRRATVRPVAGIATGAAFAVLGAVVGGLLGQLVGWGRGPTGGLVGAVGVGLGAGPIGGLLGGAVGGLAGGLGVGLTAGMAPGVPAGVLNGLGGGVAAALILVIAGRRSPALGLRGLNWSGTPAIAAGSVAGIGLGMTAGLVAGLAGALAGFCLGLLNPDADQRPATSPRVALLRDRSTFLTLALASGGTTFAGASLAVAPIVGVAGGITVGLVFGCLQAAWGKYTIARYWLALRRQVPWRLMTFLIDAHEKRGVLRQVGAVYQFRHADLQRHLAKRR